MKHPKYELCITEIGDPNIPDSKDNTFLFTTRSLTKVLDAFWTHDGSSSWINWVKKNGRIIWRRE